MPTNFPTSVDNFTNPTANDSLNIPSHSLQHANANDAIEAVEAYLLTGAGSSGLVKVIPSSVVGGTLNASGTVTIGSAVSTVSLNGCFTSAYDSYRIIYAPLSSSATGSNLNIRFRTGGTDNTTSSYGWTGNATNFAGAASQVFGATQSSMFIGYGSYPSQSYGNYAIDVFDPFLAQFTFLESQGIGVASGGNTFRTNLGGLFSNATSFDGISFIPNAGTLTGGTIRVYGYK